MNPKQQLAEMLNGRPYRDEVDSDIRRYAKENGLVIVYGYSDDNIEFDGAIEEEIGCYGGQQVFFNKNGSNFTDMNGEPFMMYHTEKDKPEANCVEAAWCEDVKVFHPKGDYYSWTYQTDIPHETFDILDEGEPYCRGIVFSVSDLAQST